MQNSKVFEKKRIAAKTLVKHLALIALIFVILIPVIFVISISLNPTGSLNSPLWPKDFSLVHWKYVLGIPYIDPTDGVLKTSPFPILLWLYNSIKVSTITAILMLALSTTSAYALSRFQFRGKQLSLLSLMLIQMFPNIMAMVAFYLILDFIGAHVPLLANDTHGGLILVYLGGTPFNIWLIKGYFDSLPKSLEESAIIDGATRFQAFYKVMLPLCVPIVAVVGLLTFINTFSDFITPSIILKSQDKFTFSVGIQIFVSEAFSARWGQFAAASILGATPICLIFFAIQKYIVSGLSAGSTKG